MDGEVEERVRLGIRRGVHCDGSIDGWKQVHGWIDTIDSLCMKDRWVMDRRWRGK